MKINNPGIQTSEAGLKTRNWSPRTLSFIICLLTSMLILAGCPHHVNREILIEQIEQLETEKSDLTYKLEQTEMQNEQLEKQVYVLSGLPENKKIDNLNTLYSIKVGKLTNLYDQDKNGKYDTLIVYLQPIDHDGDKIKVSGMADVQLWDLNRENGQALLGAWRVEPQELKKRWIAFVVINYRLKFDVSEIIDTYKEPLTVKVTFTDYLTGKVFKEQKVIEPRTP